MIIQFVHIGKSLGTRVKGQEIRQKIEKAFDQGNFVTFDLEGVESVSHSFADECFGKLLLNWSLSEIKENSTFIHANDLIKQTIAFTIKERLIEMPAA